MFFMYAGGYLLARALPRKLLLLLLDEATSSLDAESERQILEAIDALSGAITIVVIAHRSSTLLKADTIVAFDEGRIIQEIEPDESDRIENGYHFPFAEE
jgi:ABC-type bacteriocin/lantibiotic exporter with double-glycine peptidase domain